MTLDPQDWNAWRAQAHAMLDDVLDYVQHIRERPVWQPMPAEARQHFQQQSPRQGVDVAAVHDEFLRYILPYAVGNVHPGFMGWVHGGGCVAGLVAEMLAAGLNANLGGRNQAPIEVERQVVEWVRQWFDFPTQASGLFVTGTSMANFIGIVVARTAALGEDVRKRGLGAPRLVGYASSETHESVARAMDLCGLGTDALRLLPSLDSLAQAVREDRAAGHVPFLVVGNAGTVNSGVVDDLAGLAEFCREQGLWFHVDGAYGALAILAPGLAPRLRGIEKADSIAFDFHKWGQVQYDAGFILVRNGDLHRRTFASAAAYLRRETRGLASGSPWPCDYGPDLSRGFRALKTWFVLKVHGTDQIGALIERSCELAQYLKRRVESSPQLELLAAVTLNIVCFRYRGSDDLNARIIADLQESGAAAPSATTIDGKVAIRAALFNHRTQEQDVDRLVDAVLTLGSR